MKNKMQLGSLTKTIRLFYFLKLFCMIYYIWIFFNYRNIEEATWLWPIAWSSKIATPLYSLAVLASIVICSEIISIFKPYNVFIKVIEFFSSFVFISAYFSFGTIDHSMHGILYVSLFICLIKHSADNKLFTDQMNILLFKSSIAIFLFPYFLSGLWKARFVVHNIFSQGFSDLLLGTLSYQLTKNMIISGFNSPLAQWMIHLNSMWQAFIWAGVILFELSISFIVFNPKCLKLGGTLLITFHILIYLVMGISFFESIFLALIFLVFGPYRPYNPTYEA